MSENPYTLGAALSDERIMINHRARQLREKLVARIDNPELQIYSSDVDELAELGAAQTVGAILGRMLDAHFTDTESLRTAILEMTLRSRGGLSTSAGHNEIERLQAEAWNRLARLAIAHK